MPPHFRKKFCLWTFINSLKLLASKEFFIYLQVSMPLCYICTCILYALKNHIFYNNKFVVRNIYEKHKNFSNRLVSASIDVEMCVCVYGCQFVHNICEQLSMFAQNASYVIFVSILYRVGICGRYTRTPTLVHLYIIWLRTPSSQCYVYAMDNR